MYVGLLVGKLEFSIVTFIKLVVFKGKVEFSSIGLLRLEVLLIGKVGFPTIKSVIFVVFEGELEFMVDELVMLVELLEGKLAIVLLPVWFVRLIGRLELKSMIFLGSSDVEKAR